jgi:chromatin remodeling complex protein RSC6
MKKTYNVINDTLSQKKQKCTLRPKRIVCHLIASASFEVCGRVKRDQKDVTEPQNVYIWVRGDPKYANRKGNLKYANREEKGTSNAEFKEDSCEPRQQQN